MPALSILIGVLVTFVVILLVLYLVNLLPIEGRLKQILRVIVIILGILSLVRYFGVGFLKISAPGRRRQPAHRLSGLGKIPAGKISDSELRQAPRGAGAAVRR